MKHRFASLQLLILILSAPLPAAAEAPLPLDLPGVLERAEGESGALRNLDIDQAAALRRQESMARWIPGITAGAGISRTSPLLSSLTDPDGFGNEPDHWSLRGSVAVDLSLDLTKKPGLADQIRLLETRQAVLRRDTAVADLRNSVARLYFQILAGADTIAVQEAALDLADSRLSQIQTQYEQGRRSDLELLSARIAAARGLPALQKARTDQEKRLLSLRQYLGLEPDQEVTLLPAEPLPDSELPGRELMLARLEESDSVLSARLQLSLAEKNRDLSRKNLLGPSVSLSLGWSTSLESGLDPAGWSTDDWSDRLGLGLSFSLPLDSRISGSADQETLTGAEEGIRKLETTLEESRKTARARLLNLLLDLDLSRENIRIDELSVTLQEQNFAKVRENFESGRTPLLDLNDSRQELLAARLTLENEKLNYRLLLLDLERLTGPLNL